MAQTFPELTAIRYLQFRGVWVAIFLSVFLSAQELPLSGTQSQSQGQALLPPVHPRRNVEELTPVLAKKVRMIILETNHGEPCIDELEIWTDTQPPANVALAGAGARVSASGALPGYQIHQLSGINDGHYGNGSSWIADNISNSWVEIELPEPTRIKRIVWGRDREGNFVDRLITGYRFEIAQENDEWQTIASSENRRPLGFDSHFIGQNPVSTLAINRFAPFSAAVLDPPRPVHSEYVIDNWRTEHGLPNNNVTSVLQARDGYLWIGTLGGLVRFDGVDFELFDDADGIPSPRITALAEQESGVLWVGTEGGLVTLRDGRFEAEWIPDLETQPAVLSLAVGEDQSVWMGAMNGLFLNRQGNWLDYAKAYSFTRQPYLQVAPQDPSTIYALTPRTILLYIKNDQALAPPFIGEPSLFSSLFAMAPGKDGSTWIGGANAYVARLGPDGEITALDLSQTLVTDTVWEILEAENGDVWIGASSGGVLRWRDGSFLTLTTENGLASNSIRALTEDREGNIWVGSNGGGLMRLKPRKARSYGFEAGLSHPVVMSMTQTDDNRIWVGSNCGGLNVWESGEFTAFPLSYLLDNECIWSVTEGPDGSLWIGTWGNGVMRLSENKIEHFHSAQNGLPDDHITALMFDQTGVLWVGTFQGGLCRYVNGEFLAVDIPQGVSPQSVTSILNDHQGRIWIGTAADGLALWEDGAFRFFGHQHGLGSRAVRCLYEDTYGRLWIGTAHGLSCQVDENRFVTLTHENGLEDAFISQILEDQFGHLWLGSNQGIFRLQRQQLEGFLNGELKQLESLVLGKAEGLEAVECTGGFYPAGLKTESGELWFSTVQGIVRIQPDTIETNPVPPLVWIDSVWLDDQVWMSRVINQEISGSDLTHLPVQPLQSGAEIPTGTARIEFHFDSLSLVAPERNQFRCRLKGLSDEWMSYRDERKVVYSALPPGNYEFEVLGSNNDGVWSADPVTYAFKVPAYWYQTLWFQISWITLVLGSAVWTVRKVSFRKLKDRTMGLEKEKALEQERSRIAKDIHDDLGAGLTQISWLCEFAEKKLEPNHPAQEEIRQMSVTSHEIVQSMDSIVWTLNPGNDSLESLATYIPKYATDFLSKFEIRCRVDIPDNLPEWDMSAERRHNLLLIVKEALNNIVKHAHATEVRVRFRAMENQFELSLEDNGIGFQMNTVQIKGNGLENMKSRATSLGGSLSVESELGSGVKIKIGMSNYGKSKD